MSEIVGSIANRDGAGGLVPLEGDRRGPGASGRDLLVASWERSSSLGLRRKDSVLFSNPVTHALKRRAVEENHQLLSHANPELLRLYRGFGSARWLALCLNASGQIIGSVGDSLSAPNELRALMHPGRSLRESDIGTTAPGLVLELGQPVSVSCDQHYLNELSRFYCASEPLIGPDGSLVGALDLSGIDVGESPMAVEMVALAARHIENSMLRTFDDCVLFHFHSDDRVLGTPFEALLAVTSEGRVMGANRTARKFLSLPRLSERAVQLDSLFDVSIDRLERACSDGLNSIKLRSIRSNFVHARLEGTRLASPSRGRVAPWRTVAATENRKFVLHDASLTEGLDKAARALAHDLPILLQGETGTGKEVFARELHQRVRSNGPFFALNCAAIPESLIESELFGYVDGAFTGGKRGGAKGKIEMAQGGVLFLDEIGDMPLGMQSRLLRVVQERSVMRIGGDKEIPIDVMFISATHHDVKQLCAQRLFREDLFYRLNGFKLRLTPLRERTDKAEIIESLLRRSCGDDGEGISLSRIITPSAFERLYSHAWPGNVRQLEQAIRQLCALRSVERPIDVTDLPEEYQGLGDNEPAQGSEPRTQSPARSYRRAQDQIIQQALRDHNDNVSEAARALGISRTTIYKKMKQFDARSDHSMPSGS